MSKGGKDGAPFPVPLKVYDETIKVLKYAVVKARLGVSEELSAIKRLDMQARAVESTATGPSFYGYIAEEWRRSDSISCPVRKSQNFTSPVIPPLTRVRPSGEMPSPVTRPMWP